MTLKRFCDIKTIPNQTVRGQEDPGCGALFRGGLVPPLCVCPAVSGCLACLGIGSASPSGRRGPGRFPGPLRAQGFCVWALGQMARDCWTLRWLCDLGSLTQPRCARWFCLSDGKVMAPPSRCCMRMRWASAVGVLRTQLAHSRKCSGVLQLVSPFGSGHEVKGSRRSVRTDGTA